MDESIVRRRAEAHAEAVVAGDLRRAASDLAETAREGASGVMAKLPRPLVGADVVSVDQTGEEAVARIRYFGDGAETIVASRWADRGGRPMIVVLALEGEEDRTTGL
jgi:hypothetical protein